MKQSLFESRHKAEWERFSHLLDQLAKMAGILVEQPLRQTAEDDHELRLACIRL